MVRKIPIRLDEVPEGVEEPSDDEMGTHDAPDLLHTLAIMALPPESKVERPTESYH